MKQLKGDRKKAALVLFAAGFSLARVARLLAVTKDQVITAMRKAL